MHCLSNNAERGDWFFVFDALFTSFHIVLTALCLCQLKNSKMSAETITESATPSEDVPAVEAESKMDTSAEVPVPEETSKSVKRKRSLKKTEPDEPSLSNTRPRRTLPKREET